jgi:hypothetical protein
MANLGSDNTNRMPSPTIWGDCPFEDVLEQVRNGFHFYDDFQRLSKPGTLTTEIGFGGYKAYATSGSTIVRTKSINSVLTPGGALSQTHNADNNSAAITQYFGSGVLTGSVADAGKLWFEACFSQNSILTNMASVFLGLGEVDLFTLAATVPLNAGDGISNAGAMVGFQLPEDGLGTIDTVYSDRATSFTRVKVGAASIAAAYTFIKLGLKYDPENVDGKAIRFFANGVELTDYISATTLAATTNLKAGLMGVMLASCADSAGTSYANYMKWWRFAQVFDKGGGALP